MTESKFLEKKFVAFEQIDYHSSRSFNIDGERGAIIPCILLAIDYDERLLKLVPVPDGVYEEKPFWVRCDNCEISRPKLKAVK